MIFLWCDKTKYKLLTDLFFIEKIQPCLGVLSLSENWLVQGVDLLLDFNYSTWPCHKWPFAKPPLSPHCFELAFSTQGPHIDIYPSFFSPYLASYWPTTILCNSQLVQLFSYRLIFAGPPESISWKTWNVWMGNLIVSYRCTYFTETVVCSCWTLRSLVCSAIALLRPLLPLARTSD